MALIRSSNLSAASSAFIEVIGTLSIYFCNILCRGLVYFSRIYIYLYLIDPGTARGVDIWYARGYIRGYIISVNKTNARADKRTLIILGPLFSNFSSLRHTRNHKQKNIIMRLNLSSIPLLIPLYSSQAFVAQNYRNSKFHGVKSPHEFSIHRNNQAIAASSAFELTVGDTKGLLLIAFEC